jgi:hypothetical protein
MGMLDDAIRQHLELKKRSGATETEVDRLESEAFGPARREAAPIAAPVDPPSAAELPPPPAAPPEPAATGTPESATVVQPIPAREPAVPAAEEPSDSWLDDDDDEDVAPELPPVTGQPTSEFTANEVRDARGGVPESDYVAPDEEGEDLLEETPEFLQETPEHDRLWFEQKPPRDFDFDQ